MGATMSAGEYAQAQASSSGLSRRYQMPSVLAELPNAALPQLLLTRQRAYPSCGWGNSKPWLEDLPSFRTPLTHVLGQERHIASRKEGFPRSQHAAGPKKVEQSLGYTEPCLGSSMKSHEHLLSLLHQRAILKIYDPRPSSPRGKRRAKAGLSCCQDERFLKYLQLEPLYQTSFNNSCPSRGEAPTSYSFHLGAGPLGKILKRLSGTKPPSF